MSVMLVRKTWLAPFAAMAVLVACSAQLLPPRVDLTASVEDLGFIAAPSGSIFGTALTWLPARQQLAVALLPPNAGVADDHIYTVGLDGAGLQRVPLPNDPPCALTFHAVPGGLPDGRLTYIQGCVGR